MSEEMMANDLALETEAVERLNEFIQLAHTPQGFRFGRAS